MEEISKILKSSANNRYRNFIQTILETQQVWFLEYEDAYTMFKMKKAE